MEEGKRSTSPKVCYQAWVAISTLDYTITTVLHWKSEMSLAAMHNTIRKTFTVGPNLKDIVLGIGESRSFNYKHETAKLWFVIPIKSYNVICGANIHEKSIYGTYYGNSKDNKFYAVQHQKPTTKPPGKKRMQNVILES